MHKTTKTLIWVGVGLGVLASIPAGSVVLPDV